MMKYLLRPFAAVYPTRLCACSRTAGSWLYGEKPFRVFNNAIELDRFTYDASKRKAVRQELGLGDELVLGHVGRFCYAKNHEFLLDVMAEVCKQRPDAVLLLIGEGESEAAARRKAEALGLQENVRFLGRQSDPAKFYQAMDAFVLPSRYEGLGIVADRSTSGGIAGHLFHRGAAGGSGPARDAVPELAGKPGSLGGCGDPGCRKWAGGGIPLPRCGQAVLISSPRRRSWRSFTSTC